MISKCIQDRLSILIHGERGVGKWTLIESVVKETGLRCRVMDWNTTVTDALATCLECDIILLKHLERFNLDLWSVFHLWQQNHNGILIATCVSLARVRPVYLSLFHERIFIPLPDFNQRQLILRKYETLLGNKGVLQLAKECHGITARELVHLVRDAFAYDNNAVLEEALKAIRRHRGHDEMPPCPVGHQELQLQLLGLFESLYSSSSSLLQGILLYGPPGTGKTMFIRYLSHKAQLPFHIITCSNLLSSAMGETEATLRHVFQAAEQQRPCLLVFDEIDALFNDNASLVTQIISLLDQWKQRHIHNIVWLAATNFPWRVPAALLERVALKYYVGLPCLKEREEHLMQLLNNAQLRGIRTNEIHILKMAEISDGRSHADLVFWMQWLEQRAVRQNNMISMKDVELGLERIPIRLTKELLSSYQQWEPQQE